MAYRDRVYRFVPEHVVEANVDELVIVGDRVVTAGFLAACMHLGKVEGADRMRKLNRAERRRLKAKSVETT